MTTRPSPSPLSAPRNLSRSSYPPAPQAERFAAVPSALLQAAARRVVTAWERESGKAQGEVLEIVEALALGVHRQQVAGEIVVDTPARSVLGQRLLELLRSEVIQSWSAAAAAPAEVLAALTAIERVRVAIEPDWLQDFTSRLAGPNGLEIVVDVAHDLRSPLTSILFLAETLQRGQSGDVNDVQRRQLGLIYSAALGLSALVSDAIELARGGDELVEKQPVPFSVAAALESVRDIVRPIAEEKQLAVRVLPPTRDHRLGHPVALSRVLLNLTTNALKFTEAGYVEIVTQELGPSQVEFAVRDSGKGIAPEVVESLYQPLRPAVGRPGYSFSQTGLGLTMCRKLLAAMGSELKVETRPGWGARFHFVLTLPPCPEPGAEPPRRTRPGRRPRG